MCFFTGSSLERWEDSHVKLLISCWEKQKQEFGKGKHTKKEIFNRIASEFNTICTDVKVTGEQCCRKWLKLEAAHKMIMDHNNTTGADKKTWKYFDEMEACIGGKPNVRPKFTIESSSSSSTADIADTGDDDDSAEETVDDEIGATKRKSKEGAHGGKRRKRKRKSKSSAAEMLSFLSQYAERREESEREKTELMKESKEERKEFYDKFLQIMSQRK